MADGKIQSITLMICVPKTARIFANDKVS